MNAKVGISGKFDIINDIAISKKCGEVSLWSHCTAECCGRVLDVGLLVPSSNFYWLILTSQRVNVQGWTRRVRSC